MLNFNIPQIKTLICVYDNSTVVVPIEIEIFVREKSGVLSNVLKQESRLKAQTLLLQRTSESCQKFNDGVVLFSKLLSVTNDIQTLNDEPLKNSIMALIKCRNAWNDEINAYKECDYFKQNKIDQDAFFKAIKKHLSHLDGIIVTCQLQLFSLAINIKHPIEELDVLIAGIHQQFSETPNSHNLKQHFYELLNQYVCRVHKDFCEVNQREDLKESLRVEQKNIVLDLNDIVKELEKKDKTLMQQNAQLKGRIEELKKMFETFVSSHNCLDHLKQLYHQNGRLNVPSEVGDDKQNGSRLNMRNGFFEQ